MGPGGAVRTGRRRPRSLEDLVPWVLGELGLEGAGALIRIVERWEAAVGPEVARHARPAALRDGALEVAVDSSVWCQELQLHRARILEALRRELGDEAPSALWLRMG